MGAKGLSGLLRVSRKLGGGLIGADYASIQYVHSECRKQYTYLTNVLLKRKRKLEDETPEPPPRCNFEMRESTISTSALIASFGE